MTSHHFFTFDLNVKALWTWSSGLGLDGSLLRAVARLQGILGSLGWGRWGWRLPVEEPITSSSKRSMLMPRAHTHKVKQSSWGASLIAQLVKNLPAMQETWVWSLGSSPGEGNGNPLQYSCLKNPTDKAWQATVHGVTESDMAEWLTHTHTHTHVHTHITFISCCSIT